MEVHQDKWVWILTQHTAEGLAESVVRVGQAYPARKEENEGGVKK